MSKVLEKNIVFIKDWQTSGQKAKTYLLQAKKYEQNSEYDACAKYMRLAADLDHVEAALTYA